MPFVFPSCMSAPAPQFAVPLPRPNLVSIDPSLQRIDTRFGRPFAPSLLCFVSAFLSIALSTHHPFSITISPSLYGWNWEARGCMRQALLSERFGAAAAVGAAAPRNCALEFWGWCKCEPRLSHQRVLKRVIPCVVIVRHPIRPIRARSVYVLGCRVWQASELKEMTYFQLLEPGTVLFDQQVGMALHRVTQHVEEKRTLLARHASTHAIHMQAHAFTGTRMHGPQPT
eukprot:68880-Pleurochrysis_carterae.AAC.3